MVGNGKLMSAPLAVRVSIRPRTTRFYFAISFADGQSSVVGTPGRRRARPPLFPTAAAIRIAEALCAAILRTRSSSSFVQSPFEVLESQPCKTVYVGAAGSSLFSCSPISLIFRSISSRRVGAQFSPLSLTRDALHARRSGQFFHCNGSDNRFVNEGTR